MPRKHRIDVIGAVHHVSARGIDRGRIFSDDKDYKEFVRRLGGIVLSGRAGVLAWALMPNHIHLVIRTGTQPLSRMMHRLLLGYTIVHNRKVGRKGHLFEGRFKSTLCDEEKYLLELVRYVHLNPVRAGLVHGLSGLARYKWSGHRCLLGYEDYGWQKAGEVLERFGKRAGEARTRYLEFLDDGLKNERKAAWEGPVLKRLVEGGWQVVKDVLEPEKSGATESIMGRGKFIERILREANETERWKSGIRRKVTPAEAIKRAAKEAGITVAELKGPGKFPKQCVGRALACYWLTDILGLKEVEAGRMLGITQSAVSININKGIVIEINKRISLLKGRK